jgi:NAD(P)-dependent dehydrogenase (short-subunit alcohol dehydrogenase family)
MRMTLFDLSGKTAIVTGSTRGIGRAVAERLAEHGARVVVSSRKAEACDQVAAEINARWPGRAVATPCNISSKEALHDLVDETLRRWQRVDVLVCNAAANPHDGPMAEIDDVQFRTVLDHNILANHWLIQRVVPGMVAHREGSVVLMSSIGGFRGTDRIGAYSLSKAAQMQLARNLAVELGRHQVRVNCIAPGLVRTDFARPLWADPRELDRMTRHVPLRRIGEPDDIAGAAVFLASAASRFVTGQTLVVDGGATVV